MSFVKKYNHKYIDKIKEITHSTQVECERVYVFIYTPSTVHMLNIYPMPFYFTFLLDLRHKRDKKKDQDLGMGEFLSPSLVRKR